MRDITGQRSKSGGFGVYRQDSAAAEAAFDSKTA